MLMCAEIYKKPTWKKRSFFMWYGISTNHIFYVVAQYIFPYNEQCHYFFFFSGNLYSCSEP